MYFRICFWSKNTCVNPGIAHSLLFVSRSNSDSNCMRKTLKLIKRAIEAKRIRMRTQRYLLLDRKFQWHLVKQNFYLVRPTWTCALVVASSRRSCRSRLNLALTFFFDRWCTSDRKCSNCRSFFSCPLDLAAASSASKRWRAISENKQFQLANQCTHCDRCIPLVIIKR